MAEYIEGRRAVVEALRAGAPLKRAFVQRPAKNERPDKKLEQLAMDLKRANVTVNYVQRPELDKLSSHGAHQGIVVEANTYGYSSLGEIIAAAKTQNELVLVLDHITDEGNFGAIIRSAEVMGAAGVVIPAKRAAQVSVGVYKTSAGAALHLKIARVPNIVAALDQLKEAGFWVAGASEHAKQTIWQAPLEGKIALVSGSEGTGISPLVQKNCDFLVSLPQRGKVGSLNVAQATTAICYEWLRRTLTAQSPGAGE